MWAEPGLQDGLNQPQFVVNHLKSAGLSVHSGVLATFVSFWTTARASSLGLLQMPPRVCFLLWQPAVVLTHVSAPASPLLTTHIAFIHSLAWHVFDGLSYVKPHTGR